MHKHCDHDHHSHDHHGHNHAHSKDYGRIFLWGILLNSAFIASELYYGFASHSLALIADAGHNASDVAGLLLAWGAWALGRKKPSGRYTYGLQSASIMATLANALLLLAAVGAIAWEAAQRFSEPALPQTSVMMLVAFIGIIINGATAWLLHGSHKQDMNMRGAYLHMLADAGISLGVVLSGALIMATGWLWVDPAISIVIALLIVVGTWRLLRDSAALALHGVPRNIDIEEVKSFIKNQPGIAQVHDLHIWAMSTTSIALSAHLLMPAGHPGDGFIHTLTHALAEKFHIDHATLQIETSSNAKDCMLSSHAD
jgi:cobalt-zinc-cadmium efflux system protein